MTSRSNKNRETRDKASRLAEYFLPGAGIDREVIQADICRYLGRDALVKPGKHPNSNDSAPGFIIKAYRMLTTEQIEDLKADSIRWIAERNRNTTQGQSSRGISPRGANYEVRQSNRASDGYRASATRARQDEAPESSVQQSYPAVYGQGLGARPQPDRRPYPEFTSGPSNLPGQSLPSAQTYPQDYTQNKNYSYTPAEDYGPPTPFRVVREPLGQPRTTPYSATNYAPEGRQQAATYTQSRPAYNDPYPAGQGRQQGQGTLPQGFAGSADVYSRQNYGGGRGQPGAFDYDPYEDERDSRERGDIREEDDEMDYESPVPVQSSVPANTAQPRRERESERPERRHHKSRR